MTDKILTGECRFAFPRLFKAEKRGTSENETYSVKLLVPKTDRDTYVALRRAQIAAIKEGESGVWGGRKKVRRNEKGTPVWGGEWDTIKDGDNSDYEEDEGHWTLVVSTRSRPGIVDRARHAVTDESRVYSGVYGRVTLICKPYKSEQKSGVTFYLNNVQLMRDGTPLDGRTAAEDDFDALDPDDDQGGDFGDDVL